MKEYILYACWVLWVFGLPLIAYGAGYWRGRWVELRSIADDPIGDDPDDGERAPANDGFGPSREKIADMLRSQNEVLEQPLHWRKLNPAAGDKRDAA